MIRDVPYQTIVVDPPWTHRSPGAMHGANGRKGSRPTYRRMSLNEIKALGVRCGPDRQGRFHPVTLGPVLVAEQAHCWLWVTQEHLRHADGILEAWGFRPVTGRVWVKPRPANGYWFGGDVEYVRLGVCGPVYRADAKAILGYHPRASFQAPARREHSSKPDLFFREAAAISPGPNRVSLFERTPRAGWDAWGDQYREEGA